jgi:hypothetical protein
MKKLITIIIASLCLFIGTASADKPDKAGKGKHAKDAREMQKEISKQHKDKHERDDNEYGKKDKDKNKNKNKNKGDDHDKPGKHDETMERLREKKVSSEQKEVEHLSDSAREKRKKWWKFWE